MSPYTSGPAGPDQPDQDQPPGDQAQPAWATPGVSGPAPAAETVCGEVAAVQQAVARLRERSRSGRPVDVAALYGLSEALRGIALAELAELDATGGCRTTSPTATATATATATTASWLRETRTCTDVAARAEVRLAHRLTHELPQLAALLRQGRTTIEHVRAAAAGTSGLDPTLVQDSDQAISVLAQHTDPTALRHQLRERAEAVNPELARQAERRAHDRRGFTLDHTGPSGFLLGGSLSVEDGQLLQHGLDLAVTADRTDGDTRSLRQRRADVLLNWARQEVATRTSSPGQPANPIREDLRSTRAQLLLSCTLDQLTHAVTTTTTAAAGGGPAGRNPFGPTSPYHPTSTPTGSSPTVVGSRPAAAWAPAC